MVDNENAAILTPPDIGRWRVGNTGVDYVHRLSGGKPGPSILVTALMHGNEACGAVALDRLLGTSVRPTRGTLTLAFLNVQAFARIDPRKPEQGRFVDEDMNRVWSFDKIEGPGKTIELDRARAVRPIVDASDHLLDLHSMTEGEVPLALSGTTTKGIRLAQRVRYPATVVADPGHSSGVRLRDYADFGDPASEKSALLVECGQHFSAGSADVAFQCALRFLNTFDMLDPTFAARHLDDDIVKPQRFVEVTHVVTIETDAFEFKWPVRPLEIIAKAGTLLALDGTREVRTPYDNCVPIMPAKKIKRGLTAVRLGRYFAQGVLNT
ncbi:MAG TPA: succinylglutamate desuccinylase/aspartoacylase family protein [Alphaproteobacteria bacterium]|nr:succinylglutamate desuccinylase/aspartoacylase family protein [Alphaproteobacteria bacterium]